MEFKPTVVSSSSRFENARFRFMEQILSTTPESTLTTCTSPMLLPMATMLFSVFQSLRSLKLSSFSISLHFNFVQSATCRGK